ncbi:hypothetical protein [Niallia sp. FSL W8-1348]|uniref:hypothetical protein n=1 Tax=Niallia sp. FSL W8-1348 TaxID=2954656 RepID=UPI0030F877C4
MITKIIRPTIYRAVKEGSLELITDKEIRKIVISILKLIKEESFIDRKEYEDFEVNYISEYEELINERQNESTNVVKDELKREISLSYLM